MFTLNFTAQELQIVLTALSKEPYSQVFQIIDSIKNQVNNNINKENVTDKS